MSEDQKIVLVVDDEPGIVEIVQANLEAEGYAALGAENGVDGLRIIKESSPDLVILDVRMPEMNGWEVLERVESDPGTAGLPIVMLTVRSEQADFIKGLEKGAVEYVTKPFDPTRLMGIVRWLLEESDQRGRDAHRRQLIAKRKRLMRPLDSLFRTGNYS